MNAFVPDDAFESGFIQKPVGIEFDGCPLTVQGTGVFIGTNRESQHAAQVFVDTFYGLDNLNEVQLIHRFVKRVASVPPLNGSDQSAFGQQGHQTPQVLVGNMQLFDQEFSRHQFLFLHGHEAHDADGVT